jgi:hypothetical protein
MDPPKQISRLFSSIPARTAATLSGQSGCPHQSSIQPPCAVRKLSESIDFLVSFLWTPDRVDLFSDLHSHTCRSLIMALCCILNRSNFTVCHSHFLAVPKVPSARSAAVGHSLTKVNHISMNSDFLRALRSTKSVTFAVSLRIRENGICESISFVRRLSHAEDGDRSVRPLQRRVRELFGVYPEQSISFSKWQPRNSSVTIFRDRIARP